MKLGASNGYDEYGYGYRSSLDNDTQASRQQ